ncbi:hypothetical protein BU16DRAFT_566879 [Lophium mytilinum]|uniref:Uncharacterized protein n=1 Tax=Lophium mytilinum TaxID=390894 RepID=A0A6A6QE74_9PEZI|nr:hypothetical protein BU16DRAFT_566879 [Lophium mytilinum]
MCRAEPYHILNATTCFHPPSHAHFIKIKLCSHPKTLQALKATAGTNIWDRAEQVTKYENGRYSFSFRLEPALKLCDAYNKTKLAATRVEEGAKPDPGQECIVKNVCPRCATPSEREKEKKWEKEKKRERRVRG